MTNTAEMNTTAFVGPRVMPEELKGIKVVDIDTHFTEPPDLWTSQAPAAYKDHVPTVRRTGPVDQWFFRDNPMGPVSITVIGTNRTKHQGTVTLDRYDEVDAATFDPKERLALMDDTNIWAQIVFPNAAGFGGGNMATLVPEDNRNVCTRIYNDAVAEWASGSNGRLLPQALVPFWDIQEATKEAVRIKEELGLSGIAATSAPEEYEGMPDYGDEAWDPFWEVCSDLEIPISFHIGGGATVQGQPWPSFGLDLGAGLAGTLSAGRGTRQMAPIAAAALMASLMNGRPMINIIYSGLLDRWPKLKFISVESGLGWLPFFLEMAEYQFDEMTYQDKWGLQRRPREYFRDHWYVSWWFENFAPKHALEEVGVNNVLFETDFPHPTCLWPDPLEHAAEVLKDHPFEVRKRVMQDNAAELWKISV